MYVKWFVSLIICICARLGLPAVHAQNVTITPLGAQAGEFCAGDRALLFEDPTGVRVLIAPGLIHGSTVACTCC